VRVDMRIANIFGFSSREKTYNVQGVIWLHYSRELADKLKAVGHEPIDLLNIYNRIHPWNSRTTSLGPARESADGRINQGYSFDGLFYSDRIDYISHPFGSLTLRVVMQPQLATLPDASRPIQLEPGLSEVGSRVGIEGYQPAHWRFIPRERGSHSAIGDNLNNQLQRLQFEITYRANIEAALLKWVLPLAIVMLVVLLSPFIPNGLGGERLAIAPTVLLTLVFMLQSYRETLPTLPYLTFLDTLYSYSFIITLLFFAMFIWASHLDDELQRQRDARLQRQRDARLPRRIRRLAGILQVSSLVGYTVLVLSYLPRL